MSPPVVGWRLSIREELPSTSALLVQWAEAGEPEGAAVLARRQTAGRGRAGRGWDSPEGNLFLSVLLRPGGTAAEAPRWGLLAGVALAGAAREVAAAPDGLRLKWPNDLLLNGVKCAGILAESGLRPDGDVAWLVLGFGVNLAVAPALPDRATAALGTAEAPEAFAARLLRHLDAWRARVGAEGFAAVRDAWEALGPAPGEVLTAGHGTVGATGRYRGLGPDGALLLEGGDGLRAVTAGEVGAMRVLEAG